MRFLAELVRASRKSRVKLKALLLLRLRTDSDAPLRHSAKQKAAAGASGNAHVVPENRGDRGRGTGDKGQGTRGRGQGAGVRGQESANMEIRRQSLIP